MSSLDKYAPTKKAFVDALATKVVELNDAAQSNTQPFARQALQATADATNELVEYLNSPIIDQAIQTFHTSATERAKAAIDLKKYLTEAGLMSSDKVKWELHDNNWCVDAQVTYHDGSGDAHSVSVHYDSGSGWGGGVC